jgi:hypothetical protein
MGRIHKFSFAGRNSQHVRLFVLTLAMLCLSFAVVNWGLQYKMSLYQHSGGTAKASVAKLWTGSKDHSQAHGISSPELEVAPVLIPLLILTLFVSFRNQLQLIAFHRWQRNAPVWRLQTAPIQSAYFFRPPPYNS